MSGHGRAAGTGDGTARPTVLTWAGTDQWRAESARVHHVGEAFIADGVQLGVEPLPYRVDYRLDTGGGWVTRTLDVSAGGAGWQRSVHLARDPDGRWTCDANARGHVTCPRRAVTPRP